MTGMKLLPHMCRRVITLSGMRFEATSERDFEAALDSSQESMTVQYYIIHRNPDGSDGCEEIIREDLYGERVPS